MGCNAWNHPPGCRCGWGGDGHKGKSPGGWRGGRSTGWASNNLSIFSDTGTESRSTACPKCGSDVYFIRHNGGSVWLDPPLSPPWYKHPCFDYESKGGTRNGLLDSRSAGRGYQSSSAKIFVVDSCEHSQVFLTTKINGWLEGGDLYTLSVKGDARRLAGCLCFIDDSTGEIWSHDNASLRFPSQGTRTQLNVHRYFKEKSNAIDNKALPSKSPSVKKGGLDFRQKFPCKICTVVCSSQKNYRKHIKKVHGAVELSFTEGSGGYLVVCESKFYELGKRNDKEPLEIGGDASEGGRDKSKVDHGSSQHSLFALIESAIDNTAAQNGWAKLTDVGSFLYKQDASFNVREYGFKKLSLLFKSLDFVEVDELPMKASLGSSVVYVRRL